jgi:hypothetical protein
MAAASAHVRTVLQCQSYCLLCVRVCVGVFVRVHACVRA